MVTGGQVNFSVEASSPVQGTTVKEVLVLFKDATNGGDAASGTSVDWTPVWLSQGADGTWSGGAQAPSSGQVSFIVQAVDSDGNVAMSSNKGVDFTEVPAVQSTGSGLSGAVTSGNPETGEYYTTSPVTEHADRSRHRHAHHLQRRRQPDDGHRGQPGASDSVR